MPKAAGRSVPVCETTSHREEAVTDGVGRCLLFLVGFVNLKKKNGSLRSHQVCKSLCPINCIMLFPCAQICSRPIMIFHSPASLPHNDTSKSRMCNFFSHPLRGPVIIYINADEDEVSGNAFGIVKTGF